MRMMTRIVFLLSFLLAASRGIDQKRPPRLQPPNDQHVLSAGDTLELNCVGDSPLEWELPAIENGEEPSERLNITQSSDGYQFFAELRLENTTYLDTGAYVCKYEGTNNENEWMATARIYLFVYDAVHLIDFRTSAYSLMNVHEDDEAVIPCRPTHPNVTMTFFNVKNDREVEISDSLQRRLFKYDPQVGLTITKGSPMFHQDKVICKARLGEVEQSYNFIPNFHREPEMRDTTIQSSHEYPIKGDNFTLTCRAHFFQHYNPATELFWNYDEDPRINVTKQTVTYRAKTVGEITKTLIITNLQKSDENRSFSCYLQLKTNTKTANYKPSVYKLGYIRASEMEGYIGNISWHGSPEIERNSTHLGRPVMWIFDVFATPNPVLSWYDPKGFEIDYRKWEKYKLEFDSTKHKFKLTINEVQVPDMGHYILKIVVGNDYHQANSTKTKQVDMFLNIYSDPQVILTPQGSSISESEEKPFYIVEKMIIFSCVAQGFPMDVESLQWTFRQCHNFSSCEEEEIISPEMYSPLAPIDGLINSKYHFKYTSQLAVIPEKSGIFACSVCNFSQKTKCDKKATPVFINEFSHKGCSLEEPKNLTYIVEGDEVSLTCTASQYNFTQVEWFKHTGNGLTSASEISGVEVIDEETAFSFVSRIIFRRIRLTQGGTFVCQISGIEKNRNKTLETTINVLPKTEPVKSTSFNMNGSTILPLGGKTVILDCSMKSGRPEPVITWTKDDQPFPSEMENSSHVVVAMNGSVLKFQYLQVDDSGVYKCTARNRAGSVSGSLVMEVQEPFNLSPFVIALIVSGCVVLVILIILGIVLVWRVRVYNEKYKQLTAHELIMFENGDPASINPELGVDDQADLLPYNKKFEFPRESLKLGKQLGSGAFGRVLKAQAIGINAWERSTTVAVKMVKPNADIMYVRALMAELKIMIHLGKHLNIVNLLGACTNGLARKELLVIVEYCRFGNLQKYLLQHRHHFIDQIDPITGDINFNIGQDMIDGYGNDLPTVREQAEMSAVYLSHNNATTHQDGYLLPREQQQCNASHEEQRRNSSIRYVANPSDRNRRKRTVSIQSDYNGGNQVVNTDMTTLPEEEEDESTNTNGGRPGVSRTQSTSSRCSQNPGWRGNVRGDYDVTSVRPICTKDLICWAYQVTRGMEYLASKKVMHGDLACRNILLAQDNVVKICDFGLAKDIYKNNAYQKKTDGPLPVKWMAIESIRDRVFSTQSDVWAFGIVLWEMFSMGKTPYPGVEACDLYNMLLRGHRMEKPEVCPQQIYQMMLQTWDNEPTKRPNFLDLMDELGDLLEEGEKDHYLDLTKKFDASTAEAANNTVENKDYLAMMSPPDFATQMSVSPCEDPEGYLQPRKSPLHMDNDEYLLPNSKNQQVIEMLPLMSNGNNGTLVSLS